MWKKIKDHLINIDKCTEILQWWSKEIVIVYENGNRTTIKFNSENEKSNCVNELESYLNIRL